MKSLDSIIANLQHRAAKNTLEVEHLFALAVRGDAKVVPIIRQLQERYAWPRSNRQGKDYVVPLARWGEVVCAFLEGGADALVTYARRDEPESFSFAVSLLGDLKSSAAVLALAELAAEVERDLPKRIAEAEELAAAINLTLSFKGAPIVYEHTAAELRRFLHTVIRQKLRKKPVTEVCALRGVGDESSIELVNSLPAFTYPWSGLEKTVIRAIRKRLRQSRGGEI